MIIKNAMISYPHLIEPKENPSGKLKYSCSLLIDKSDTETVAKINAEIEKAKERGKEKLWSNKIPFFRYKSLRDGDEELESGEKNDPSYAGHYFINCSSDDPPGLVDRYGKRIIDDKVLYAGCIVHADVNPFPYKNSGNSGIGWGLNNIMFVKESGTRLDGRKNAEDVFGSFFEEPSLESTTSDLE